MELNNKILLITYADSLGSNLKELKTVLDKYYKKAVGGVHILPFFPSSADRGFAPMRYDITDESFDISRVDIDNMALSDGLRIEFKEVKDGIIHHTDNGWC